MYYIKFNTLNNVIRNWNIVIYLKFRFLTIQIEFLSPTEIFFALQVLMTNIVRRLQKDMMRDGIQVNGLTRESTAPVWSEEINQVSNLDPPPNSNESSSFVGYPIDDSGVDRPPTPIPTSDYESFGTNNYPSDSYIRCMDTDDCPRARTFAESGALWTEDRLSSLNWSSVLKSTVDLNCISSDCSMSDDVSGRPQDRPGLGMSTTLHTLMPAVTGGIEAYLSSSGIFSASSSSSSSSPMSGSTSPGSGSSPTSSSEDEIFGDVDLTLYDYDYTPLSPPNVAMAPLTAEELMWSLSHDHKQQGQDDRDYLASVLTS